jgi:hypothetical protein
MHNDPIVEDIRTIRQEYARMFDYDIQALAKDLRRHENEHPERLVTFPAKPVRQRQTA